jgi:hypothetical protein
LAGGIAAADNATNKIKKMKIGLIIIPPTVIE